VASSVRLGRGYTRSETGIFWRHYPLRNADPATFQVLNGVWARDARRIFVGDRIVRKADPATFVVLNEVYAKDAANAWAMSGPIEGADVETFEALGPGLDETYHHGYARDRNNVYHYVLTIGRPIVVKGADPAAFRLLGHGFARDDGRVYFEARPLPKANPDTWRYLGQCYSTDATRVYRGSAPIAGADPASFLSLPGDLPCAMDRARHYRDVEEREEADYLAELRKRFVFRATIEDATIVERDGTEHRELTSTGSHEDLAARFRLGPPEWLYRPSDRDWTDADERSIREFHRFGDGFSIAGFSGRRWLWFFGRLRMPSGAERLVPHLRWSEFDPDRLLHPILGLIAKLDGVA